MATDPNSISVCSFKLGTDHYLDIFELLPAKYSASFNINIALAIFSVFFLLSIFQRWTADPRALALVEKLSEVSLFVVAFWSYVTLYNNLDEVAVNLEHSFNLFHFGRFSMSPSAIVDGTVEHLYYLLLAPFAQDAPTLVFANFILGFIILSTHLLLIKTICKTLNPTFLWPAFGLFVALYYPFVSVLADGFGNSLISLGILFSISSAIQGRTRAAWVSASALPLIRPDGVLFSAVLALSFFLAGFTSWKQRIYTALSTGAALGVYLLGHRMYFGHLIPTPIAFKSVSFGRLSPDSLIAIWPFLKHWVTTVFHLTTLAAVLILVLRPKQFWASPPARLGISLVCLLTPIMIWFIICNQAHSSYLGDSISRYWVGLETALIFVTLVLSIEFPTYLSYPALLVAAVVFSVNLHSSSWVNKWSNRNELAMAGALVDRITPPGTSIASTEMNGFGFGIYRKDVIDLWGYSNPEIAASQLCNEYQQKVSPGIFNRLDPEIFFIYSYIPPDQAVDKLLKYDHFLPERSLIGDLYMALKDRSILTFDLPGGNRFSLLVSNRRIDEVKANIVSSLNVIGQTCGAFSLTELGERYAYPGEDSAYQPCSQVSLKAVRLRAPAMTY